MNNIDKIIKYSIIIKEIKKRRRKIMAARLWKKIGLFILIVACLFNIMFKLVNKLPFIEELKTSAQYMLQQNDEKK